MRFPVVRDFDAIDETEFVDIDRDFWIKNGLQDGDDAIPKTSEVFSRGDFAFYASACGGGKNGLMAGFLRLIVVMYAAGS